MGSFGTYGPYTHESIVAEFTQEWDSGGSVYKVVEPRSTSFSRRLWGIQTINGEPQCIVLWLITYCKDEWIYKPESENVGPVYYDCPLDLLDKCPVPPESKWAAEWREHVKSFHAARKAKRARKLSPGEEITLVNGDVMIVESIGKRGAIIAYMKTNNMRYRVPRNMLTAE